MPGWIIAAAIASIAATALLTLVLWRINAPMREGAARSDGGDAGGFVAAHRPDNNGTSDGGSDGGGDGGGD